MAKKHHPDWGLELRPIVPSRNGTASGTPAPISAADAAVAKSLTELQATVDRMRVALDEVGTRLVAIERAIRDTVAAPDDDGPKAAIRPLREAKPIRQAASARLEARTRRAARPPSEGTSHGDAAGG